MMAYADTSFLEGFFNPDSVHAPSVQAHVQRHAPDFCFNVLLLAELRHVLRRVRNAASRQTAWQAYRATESLRTRFVHQPLTLGRLARVVERASLADNGRSGAGTWDLAHIGLAQAAQVKIFLTCDRLQHQAAQNAGLNSHYFG